jgi:hypothetical protein
MKNKFKGILYAATSGVGTLINVHCFNKAVSLWREDDK